MTTRNPAYQPGDVLPIRVTRQGAVRVNEVTVVRDYGDCILATMDLATKYAELFASTFGDEPELYLSATDRSLHCAEGVDRDELTIVALEGLQGWRLWSSAGPGRYTLAMTLRAPESEA